MKKYFIIFSISVLISPYALGVRATSPDPVGSSNTTNTTNNGTSANSSNTANNANNQQNNLQNTSTTTTNNDFKGSSEKASKKQKIGGMLAKGAMVVCGVKAVASCASHNYGACAWWAAGAVLSAKVAADMNKTKNISDLSVGDISTTGNSSGNPHLPETVEELLNNDPEGQIVRSQLEELKKKGIVVNTRNNSIKMPDGKTYKPSDFASPEAMKNAGMSDQMIAEGTKALAEFKEHQAELASKATDGGDFGTSVSNSGGGGSGAASDEVGDGLTAPTENGLGIKRDARTVAGTSKIYNGEPIGVSVDSLFDMMKRRYELKESQGSFLQKK